MKRLVSTTNLTKQEWLRYRKGGITGTDVGAILGMNPYVSAFAVYQDKITEDIEEYDNEAMRQGRDLEEYVAQRFMEETGFKVRRANAIYYNEEHPFMLADFDRLIIGQKAGVECKTVSPYSSDKWENGATPLHYFLQVQHYLATSGFECWYLATLIYGTEFIIRKIERDEDMIRNLITIEERFWNYNVLGRHIPEPDGSDSYSEILKQQYFSGRRDNEVQLFGLEEDLRRRDEIKALVAKLEKEQKIIEQKVQLQLGEADAVYGTAGNYNISWVPTVTQRMDISRLKVEKPEIYNQYLKETQGKRFTVKLAGHKQKAA